MLGNHSIKANYFDGRSVRSIAGFIKIQHHQLIFIADLAEETELQDTSNNESVQTDLSASTSEMSWPIDQVEFPEDLGQQFPLISLPNFASIEVACFDEWKRWSEKNNLTKGVQKYQTKMIWSLLAIGIIALFGLFSWKWGIPFIAEKSLIFIPHHIDKKFGQTALDYLDESYLTESELSADQKSQIERAFKKYLNAVDPVLISDYNLVFRSSRIGPNAFALPGGSIVMTDEIVDLFDADEKALFGVFAHELGHVKNRDAMKSLVQVSALGILMNLWVGDFSSTLAAMPVLIGQAQYSREVERSADSSAARILTQAKISPLVMVQLFSYFEKYEAQQKDKLKLDLTDKIPNKTPKEKASDAQSQLESQLDHLLNSETPLGINFSSHPANQERIDFFKKAALGCQDCAL